MPLFFLGGALMALALPSPIARGATSRTVAARVGPRVELSATATGSMQRTSQIEALADQVWQLREDGVDIHVTVIRQIEAEIARLQLEETCEMLRDNLALAKRAAAGDRCSASAELHAKFRRRACSSLEQTAVPPLLQTEVDATAAVASTPALAAAVASSAVTVFAALRCCVIFSVAAVWAESSASVAASLTDLLRTLPGERLAPLLGRALSRAFGANYVPRLGYSLSTARAKYVRPSTESD